MKYGHCPTCDTDRNFHRAQHGGEMLWQCQGCKHTWVYRVLPPKAKKTRPTCSNPTRRNTGKRTAEAMATAFHGRRPDEDEYQVLTKPEFPDTLANIGKVFAIEYIAERDGKEFLFRHVFKASSRPHLAVAADGKFVTMLGGAWRFTHDGFEDF